MEMFRLKLPNFSLGHFGDFVVQYKSPQYGCLAAFQVLVMSFTALPSTDFGGAFTSYPETKPPAYSRDVISTLTRTSNPDRLYPESNIALITFPDHEHFMQWRRFLVQDIRYGRKGKAIEHLWEERNTYVVYDLMYPAIWEELVSDPDWCPFRQWGPERVLEDQVYVRNVLWLPAERNVPSALISPQTRQMSRVFSSPAMTPLTPEFVGRFKAKPTQILRLERLGLTGWARSHSASSDDSSTNSSSSAGQSSSGLHAYASQSSIRHLGPDPAEILLEQMFCVDWENAGPNSILHQDNDVPSSPRSHPMRGLHSLMEEPVSPTSGEPFLFPLLPERSSSVPSLEGVYSIERDEPLFSDKSASENFHDLYVSDLPPMNDSGSYSGYASDYLSDYVIVHSPEPIDRLFVNNSYFHSWISYSHAYNHRLDH
ncbi:uncharacterized protein EI90DRAFT_3062606 [Cantharellus anzutake]|uniref:uncharacterized protein n=1 Tax=Cantharellus anzutake TaxID=1750568 RepID=UPI001906AB2E|nr:uncharacterized protein EI90DRAFT_3062606 [Cantharellus anzutake]KAF8329434.1 hypothetical protein EI90DRAFT_3062606 [Cantharellus anzutake]